MASLGRLQFAPGRILILFLCGLAAGCSQKAADSPAAPPAPAPVAQTAPAPAPAPVESAPPVATVTQAWTPAALDELLAPIALYPDPLIGQILAVSTTPQEVLDGANWLLINQELQGDALTSAATKAGFGPAMLALVHFPTVVDMMATEMDWTRQVGDAYKADPAAVLDSIQQLRGEAYRAGNLITTPQQQVKVVSDAGREFVEIQPTNREVVYVPQYDPTQVYTTPASTEVVYVDDPNTVSTGSAVASSAISFGVGMLLGAMIFNDHDDYYYPNWGYGGVYYGGRPWGYNNYRYRPNYYGAWGVSNGYYRPNNYRYGYNNFHNNDINVNINNNYYNRFENNNNLRQNGANSPIGQNRPDRRPGASTLPANAKRPGGADRPALSSIPDRGKESSWKGQSSYAGAKRDKQTGNQRPGDGTRPGGQDRPTARPGNQDRPNQGPSTADRPTNRPGNQDRPNQRPSTQDRPSSRPANQDRPSNRPQQQDKSREQRGYPGQDRDRGGSSAPNRPSQDRSSSRNSGGSKSRMQPSSSSGQQARAASQRGRSSSQSSQSGNRAAGRPSRK